MTHFLNNYLNGEWQAASSTAHTLTDPVTGATLAATGGAAAGLSDAFAYARQEGGRALQAMTYAQRATMLAEVRGKPVYLAMAVDEHQRLKLKPQNLLLNLPLAKRS